MMFASRYRLSPHDAKALRVTDTYSLHITQDIRRQADADRHW